MALLDIRQRTGYLFVAVTIGHIILISAQVTTSRGVPLLEAVTFGLFAEIQRATTGAIGATTTSWREYGDLRGVREENDQLRRELAELRIRLQQQEALAQQSRSLQALLSLKSSIALDTVAATIIAGGASPDFRTATIDKGTRAGLRPDVAVLAPEGVVGRVILPTALAAKVQLLIDRSAAVGAMDERSRVQGVVLGTGTDLLRMEYVAGTADVKTGDRVVTSGIDGIYPKGFVIGQIESVDKGAGEYSAIVIRPAVNFSALEDVLVVLSPQAAPAAPSAPAVPASE
jgi:rod shape-determining protein MreC